MSQYTDQPVTKLRARRNTLSNAAEILRADGFVGLANRVQARAAEIHAEVQRQETLTANRLAKIKEARDGR